MRWRASAAARYRCWSCTVPRSRSIPARPGPIALAAALRTGDPPVVGRIQDDRLLLDPRTLDDVEVDAAARAVLAALGS